MTSASPVRIWTCIPQTQRRRLIAQLSQMATRFLETTRPAEETHHEHNAFLKGFGEPQDSGGALRALGGGLRAPVPPPAGAAAPGVDTAAIRVGRARPGVGLDPVARAGD